MAFTNQTARTSATGSGSVGQVVPFSFPIGSSSDLTVYSRVTATGVETLLTETTNYTVTVSGDSGGSVTTVTAVATTAQIHIVRQTPKTQTLDLTAGGAFSPENIEDAFDKQTKIAIDAHDKADRSVRFPATDPTSSISELPSSIDRASKFMSFDSYGKPSASSAIDASLVTISSFAETILDDADGASVASTIFEDMSNAERITWKGQTNLDSVFNVKDYGATGDGTTEDSDAIKAACAAGDHVFFPEGTYLITKAANALGTWTDDSDIILEFDNATLLFDSDESWTPGDTWSVFTFNRCTNVHIKGNLTIQGNITTANFSTGTADGPIMFYFAGGDNENITIDTIIADGVLVPVEFIRYPSYTAKSVAYIGDGGTGYSASDVLTVSGGDPTTATQILVDSVSGGVITAASIQTAGEYPSSSTPTVPNISGTDAGVSVTGGDGNDDAKFNIQWTEHTDNQNKNIIIKNLIVTNSWYGCGFVYGGEHIRLNNLYCDNIYRAFVGYGGLNDGDFNITFVNHNGDSVALGSGNGLGISNCRFNVTALPSAWASSTSASKVRIAYENSYPAIFENLEFNLNVEYGTGTNRGGAAFELDCGDLLDRGRRFNNVTIKGTIDGVQDEDSGTGTAVIGTTVYAGGTTGDHMGGLTIGPMEIRNSGASVLIDPRTFDTPCLLNNFVSDGRFRFTRDATSYLTEQRTWWNIVGSSFDNDFAYDGSATTIGTIQRDADLTILAAWAYGDYTIKSTTGAGATKTWTLPAAIAGMKLTLINGATTASSKLLIDPDGTEIIRGLGAGVALQLNSLGASCRLECLVAGKWEVTSIEGETNLPAYAYSLTVETTTQLGSDTNNISVSAAGAMTITGTASIPGCQLLSATTVSFAADADTAIYTVPTGKRAVLHYAVVVAAADAGATTTISIGANGSETDFLGVQTLSNLDAQYDAVILQPVPNATPVKIKSYAAATVIDARVASNSGGAGNTIYLYGTLY